MNSTAVVSPRDLLVIFNPTAGARRRRKLERFLTALDRGGAAPRLAETTAPGDAWALARAGEAEAVVVAGGDGTINEAINGLMARPPANAQPMLGVLPLGTANVLARELGLPRRPEAAAKAILAGGRRSIALGTANGRHFALMAGVGFDAAVVENLDLGFKRRLRQGAYAFEAVRQALRFSFPHYSVAVAGERHAARSVIACKARHYGGPFVLAEAAAPEAPHLQLVMFQKAGSLAVLRYAVAIALGRLCRCPGVTLIEAEAALIEGPEGEAVQGDGDILARLPLSLSVKPAALEVLVPLTPSCSGPPRRAAGPGRPRPCRRPRRR